MRRRHLVGGLVAATGWPVAGRTQQPSRWRVGFLHPGQSALVMTRVAAIREGLGKSREASEAEIVVRLADDQVDRLPSMALELIEQGVRAICAVSPPAVRAAREATRSLPIVAMDLESDPVANGWAASLGRPGGNVTGIFMDLPGFNAKSLQLLREIVPTLTRAAVFWHPVSGSLQLEAVRSAAHTLAVDLEILEVRTPADFEGAFRSAAARQCGGVLMLSSPLFGGNPQRLADLAIASRLPSINIFPEFAQKGGLLGYGPDLQNLFLQAGVLVRKALQAGSAADLPIERPTRFTLVANLRAARSLGLTIPAPVLAGADEIVE
ncbi:MAG: ABC transporter substrate-binding protein [Reyranellaceae bacterium]